MDFLWRVAKNDLLLATDDLGDAEVRKGGRLEGNERLATWLTTITVRQKCKDPRGLDDIPQRRRGTKGPRFGPVRREPVAGH